MTYSYCLQLGFRPHADYLGDVRAITRPILVMVGAADEMFVVGQYAPLLEPAQEKLRVKVLPDVSHIGIAVQPQALRSDCRGTLIWSSRTGKNPGPAATAY
ncbi:alpha/beta hydrolase [Noviherbaspirillum sp.]|uniref:alpha/beta hydrolase n=1 Tax=Noviherbaspirillum sp. TaxID=1926288 RepID=UPI002B461B26|nr:alpha/beta hydrolase [Noviherbaspirillum sp.]HJV80281.1 alpha/beta hydrolase [Noviherbaspirillum sp.]